MNTRQTRYMSNKESLLQMVAKSIYIQRLPREEETNQENAKKKHTHEDVKLEAKKDKK